jgi:hypothetical protein
MEMTMTYQHKDGTGSTLTQSLDEHQATAIELLGELAKRQRNDAELFNAFAALAARAAIAMANLLAMHDKEDPRCCCCRACAHISAMVHDTPEEIGGHGVN